MTATTVGAANGRSGRDTRKLILDAAAEVMCREGYAGTRLSDIADIAGIKTPAIYRHFPSKDGLVDEVMTVGHLRFIEHVTTVIEALPADSTPLDRVLAAVAGHLEVILAISNYAAASTRNMSQMPDADPGAATRVASSVRGDMASTSHRGNRSRTDPTGVESGCGARSDHRRSELVERWSDPERRTLESLIRNAQDLVRFGIGS